MSEEIGKRIYRIGDAVKVSSPNGELYAGRVEHIVQDPVHREYRETDFETEGCPRSRILCVHIAYEDTGAHNEKPKVVFPNLPGFRLQRLGRPRS